MTPQTLKKYGLTEDDFNEILARQGYVCPICLKVPSTGRWCVDHKHVPRYAKLKPEKRKALVRGILCWFCNRWYLAKGITTLKACRMAEYLTQFEDRQ